MRHLREGCWHLDVKQVKDPQAIRPLANQSSAGWQAVRPLQAELSCGPAGAVDVGGLRQIWGAEGVRHEREDSVQPETRDQEPRVPQVRFEEAGPVLTESWEGAEGQQVRLEQQAQAQVGLALGPVQRVRGRAEERLAQAQGALRGMVSLALLPPEACWLLELQVAFQVSEVSLETLQSAESTKK